MRAGGGWLLVLMMLCAPAMAAKLRRVEIETLRPTQFSYGAYEVGLKREQLDRLADDDALGEYKRKHPGSVVLGPGNVMYLVDGHHLARALADRGSRWMYVEVRSDWSHLSPAEFRDRMIAKELCYLKHLGETLRWEDLPTEIRGLRDDPYRSLAWLVREDGGYKQLDTPFQEFGWAEFLRTRVVLSVDPDWKAATKLGVRWARSPAAKGLPGWKGTKKNGECPVALAS
jgi:hypothetical protein